MLPKKLLLGSILVTVIVVEEFPQVLEALRTSSRKFSQVFQLKQTQDPPWAYKMSLYNCYLLDTCTPGGPRVCTWDEINGYLATFVDECTMYRVNCNNDGRVSYTIQDTSICREKRQLVNRRIPVLEADILNITTTTVAKPNTKSTKEWWWDGSTTDNFKYLYE